MLSGAEWVCLIFDDDADDDDDDDDADDEDDDEVDDDDDDDDDNDDDDADDDDDDDDDGGCASMVQCILHFTCDASPCNSPRFDMMIEQFLCAVAWHQRIVQ